MRQLTLTDERIAEILEEVKTNILINAPTSKTITLAEEINPSVKLEQDEKVKITFTKEVWDKMYALINTCEKTECGWNMTVTRKGKKSFKITDILLYPQSVTGATVTTDDEKYIEWANGLSDEVYRQNRFHGHSHVKMGVSPSATDTTYQGQIMQNITDFFIFGIFNQSGSYWLKIFDVENNVEYDSDDIIITNNVEKFTDWATEQIKEFIDEPTPVTPTYTQYNQYGNYNRFNNPNYARPATSGAHTYTPPATAKQSELSAWDKAKARQEAAEAAEIKPGATTATTTATTAITTTANSAIIDADLTHEDEILDPAINQILKEFEKRPDWEQCGFVSEALYDQDVAALRRKGMTQKEIDEELQEYRIACAEATLKSERAVIASASDKATGTTGK